MSASISDLTSNEIGGYKATISNPNTSDEAKERARETLQQARDYMESGGDGYVDDSSNREGGRASSPTENDMHNHRVLGGYKATLKNPNTSEEAKAHAEEVLKQKGAI